MRWGDFKDAMLHGATSTKWKELASADLVVGGPDFTQDIMSKSVLYNFMAILMTLI